MITGGKKKKKKTENKEKTRLTRCCLSRLMAIQNKKPASWWMDFTCNSFSSSRGHHRNFFLFFFFERLCRWPERVPWVWPFPFIINCHAAVNPVSLVSSWTSCRWLEKTTEVAPRRRDATFLEEKYIIILIISIIPTVSNVTSSKIPLNSIEKDCPQVTDII